ncbi:hypothetical protein [Candidatus Vampirococcus lugosii]|uniref:Uncharacterized protein n=1 Tax=Candidatus Vampirococcus lugosii TaxID=2789015 RepID=A0ABS5QK61_9BACT|nr:hypothetical protein [Candidatus Vampirococcus lugosii]MBS8121636.1 hypothetical protein [Candidatus Vampirococcus lugosii]
MTTKKKIYFFILTIFVIFFAWGYYIFSIFNENNKDLSADINNKNLSNTGNINQDITLSDLSKKNNQTNTNKVYIHMPKFFYERGFEIIKKQLKTKNIEVEYVLYGSIGELNEFVFENGENYDIALVPDSTFLSMGDKILDFDFSNANIRSAFNSIFYDLFDENISIIPYGIDPGISIVRDKVFWRSFDNIDFKTIKRYILINGSKNNLINFGFGKDFISGTKRGIDITYNYSSLLFDALNASIDNNNLDYIDFALELGKDGIYKGFNPYYFIRIYKSIKCDNYYSSLCVFLKGKLDIHLGYLSDIDILSQQSSFSKKDFIVYNSPFLSEENYPTKLWGFVINKNSQNINGSVNFIQSYIDMGTKGNRLGNNNILSAFNGVYSKQIDKEIYNGIRKFEKNFKNNNYNYNIGDLLNNKFIIDYVEGEIANSLFLEKLSNYF